MQKPAKPEPRTPGVRHANSSTAKAAVAEAGRNQFGPAEREARKAAAEMQRSFFTRMGGPQQFQMLFHILSGVSFFAKDWDGRFIAASPATLERVGLKEEWEIIGKTDADIHPVGVAQEIRQDDLRVMETGEPLIDRIEALYIRHHAKDWYRTSKLPIYDTAGIVIGVMGFVRPHGQTSDVASATERLRRVIDHVHRNLASPINVDELARIGCVSVRQLHRLFKEAFGMSTQNFLIRTRVQAATDALLHTEKSISEIALEHGFCDQSAFTRRFAEHTGETPLRFRKRNLGSAS